MVQSAQGCAGVGGAACLQLLAVGGSSSPMASLDGVDCSGSVEAFFLHESLVVQSAQGRAGLELVVELSGGCAGVGGRGLPGFRKGFNIRRSIVICFGN